MKSIQSVICATLVLFCSTGAMASGSFSAPSGGEEKVYNLGKKVFHKTLACEGCALSGVELDQEKAQGIVEKIQSGDEMFSSLNKKETKAVTHYLTEQYSL